jgi:hypothetical protein
LSRLPFQISTSPQIKFLMRDLAMALSLSNQDNKEPIQERNVLPTQNGL